MMLICSRGEIRFAESFSSRYLLYARRIVIFCDDVAVSVIIIC